MRHLAPLLALLAVVGCRSVTEKPLTSFRGDTLYYQDNASGQKAARHVTELFGGRQKVVLVDQEIPHASYPVPISRAKPLYPYAMYQKHLEGTVTVAFIVDEDGYVADAAVVDTTNPGFNEEALAATRKWIFRPASRLGINVRSYLSVPVIFAIQH